jgi:hypothetical protein
MEQLQPDESVIDLAERRNAGLLITLWMVRTNPEHFFVTVQDNAGPNFAHDITEGQDPWYEFQHVMSRSPQETKLRNVYA